MSEVDLRREGKEHYKAITLRSGKTLERVVEVNKAKKEEDKVGNPTHGFVELEKKVKEVTLPPKEPTLIIPFP